MFGSTGNEQQNRCYPQLQKDPGQGAKGWVMDNDPLWTKVIRSLMLASGVSTGYHCLHALSRISLECLNVWPFVYAPVLKEDRR